MKKCKNHPWYKGKKQPDCDCEKCWEIWEMKQERGKRNRPFRNKSEDDKWEQISTTSSDEY